MAKTSSEEGSIFTSITRMGKGAFLSIKKMFGHHEDEGVIPVLHHSSNLGLYVYVSSGDVVLKATEVFLGDISNLSDEGISKLRSDVSELTGGIVSLTVDQKANDVKCKFDIEKIVNKVVVMYPNKTDREKEKIIIGKIIEAANISLKGIAQVTGGELKKYTDPEALKGIGKELYKTYKKLELDARETVSTVSNNESSESVTVQDSSLTDPFVFPGNNSCKSMECIEAVQPQAAAMETMIRNTGVVEELSAAGVMEEDGRHPENVSSSIIPAQTPTTRYCSSTNDSKSNGR